MTAKISPTISIGSNIPVEAFPPKTIAKRVTTIIAIPFMPDLESPIINAANKTISQLEVESWKIWGSSKNDDMNLIDENQKLHCGECGKDFDPLARPGFLRFLSLILFSNLVMIAVTLIIEIIRFVQHDLDKLP